MKKILILLLVLLTFVGCSTNNVVDNDDCNNNQGCDISPTGGDVIETISFKESYESLNGKETSSGKTYREISINDENIFNIIDLKQFENFSSKDFDYTGILLISDPKCPWCRSVLPTAIEVAKEQSIDKIDVIHAWDAEGNEVFRDKYVEVEDGKYELQVGHPLYNYLINCQGSELLNDYIITKSDGSSFETGEKRIYLPSFLYVKNGDIVAFTTGISELQSGAYDELSVEVIEDMRTKLLDFFNLVKENS